MWEKTALLAVLALSTFALASGQRKKSFASTNWICFEPTIPTYTVPEKKLQFSMVTDKLGCKIAVPVSDGETIQISSDDLKAAEAVESVFVSLNSLETAELNRKNDGAPFSEFPHTDFYSSLIDQFNSGKDSARARFCRIYPRAYVPLLDWRGLTDPKPCSDNAPRL